MRWLRWLRDGMLAMILAAGLLCLLVTYQAHQHITEATSRGALAITEVDLANVAITAANKAVAKSFGTGNTALLLGPGTGYQDEISTAIQDLVLAAEHNIAGTLGASDIQFAEGLMVTYEDRIGQAAIDAAVNGRASGAGNQGVGPLAQSELGDATAILYQGGNIGSVLSVFNDEQKAVAADLGSRWVRPGDVWWLMLSPLLAMLILVGCTSYTLRRAFRRLISVRLVAALVLTLGLVILVAALNGHDRGQARKSIQHTLGTQTVPVLITPNAKVTAQAESEAADSGSAYSPGTLVVGILLAGGAAVLAYAAYRPRLEEYRYRP